MPKKSNKTEHVLKLITKNQEVEEQKQGHVADKAPPNEEGLHDDLKEKLKEELKEELREELKEELSSANVGDSSSADDIEEDDFDDEASDDTESEEDAFEEEKIPEPEPKSAPEPEPKSAPEPEPKSAPEPEPEPAPEPVVSEPEPKVESAKVKMPEMIAEPDNRTMTHKISPPIGRGNENLSIVNLSETLACEMMDDMMRKLNVCDCDLCRADVLAMALNYLPQKYVTTNEGKQYMQLDMFRKQYETDVLSALTRACVRVKGSPRHKK